MAKLVEFFLNKFVEQDLTLYNNFIKYVGPFDHVESVCLQIYLKLHYIFLTVFF